MASLLVLQAVELQKLILAHNSIESLKEDLRNLPQLTVLNVTHNRLSKLPAAIGEWVLWTYITIIILKNVFPYLFYVVYACLMCDFVFSWPIWQASYAKILRRVFQLNTKSTWGNWIGNFPCQVFLLFFSSSSSSQLPLSTSSAFSSFFCFFHISSFQFYQNIVDFILFFVAVSVCFCVVCFFFCS